MDDEQSVEEDDQRALRCNFIFFMSSCVKLSFYCTINYFSLYKSDMRHPFGVFLKKKVRLTNALDFAKDSGSEILGILES